MSGFNSNYISLGPYSKLSLSALNLHVMFSTKYLCINTFSDAMHYDILKCLWYDVSLTSAIVMFINIW